MKNILKITVVLLALATVIGVFFACDGGNGGTSDSTASETVAEEDDGTLGVIKNYWPEYDTSEYSVMSAKLEKWFTTYYIEGDKVPFSFTYGGESSDTFISTWTKSVESGTSDEGKTWTVTYKNPSDGFTVWAEFILYNDYPTLEWTTYAKNTSDSTSKVISNFMGCDILYVLDDSDITLHTTKGSQEISKEDVYDYELVTKKLSTIPSSYMPEEADGRSSEHAWPFYDICAKNNGLMFAIGWTGVWKASFTSSGKVVGIKSGMANLSTVVYADETIRTPLYSLTYFDGDAEYGHNLFRKTVLSHYTPDDGTEDVCKLPVSVTTESYGEEKIISDVDIWAGKLSVDTVWTDAAWFGNLGRDDDTTWATETGNWWVSKYRYPSGSLKKVSDFLHSKNLKYVVWFEMERVAEGTELYNSGLCINKNIVGSKILNLASDEGYQYMLDYIDGMIGDNGIDVYRQDFNSPGIALAWKYQDSLSTDKRDGMTEMRYIENLYKIYDTVLENHPGLMIDDCASGGKRIDLEMLKRCVVLHRSDYTTIPFTSAEITEGTFCPEGMQYQLQNLSYWLPLSGTGFGYPVSVFSDAYILRSAYSAGTGLGISIAYAADNNMAKKLTAELSDFRGFYLGDYYSLMTPTLDRTSQQALMYVREDVNEALVIVYTRPDYTGDNRTTIVLKGLDEDTTYLISDQDSTTSKIKTATGKSLMEEGITFTAYAGSSKVYVLTPYNG